MYFRQRTVPGSWTGVVETMLSKLGSCSWQNVSAVSVDLSLYLLPVEETVDTESVKYCGACLMQIRFISRRSLYMILCSTGSQCSSFSAGVTWSYTDKFMMMWAAAFIAHCRHSMFDRCRRDKSELQ